MDDAGKFKQLLIDVMARDLSEQEVTWIIEIMRVSVPTRKLSMWMSLLYHTGSDSEYCRTLIRKIVTANVISTSLVERLTTEETKADASVLLSDPFLVVPDHVRDALKVSW